MVILELILDITPVQDWSLRSSWGSEEGGEYTWNITNHLSVIFCNFVLSSNCCSCLSVHIQIADLSLLSYVTTCVLAKYQRILKSCRLSLFFEGLTQKNKWIHRCLTKVSGTLKKVECSEENFSITSQILAPPYRSIPLLKVRKNNTICISRRKGK